MFVYLADRQDITRAGMMYILSGMNDVDFRQTEDKTELIFQLKERAFLFLAQTSLGRLIGLEDICFEFFLQSSHSVL